VAYYELQILYFSENTSSFDVNNFPTTILIRRRLFDDVPGSYTWNKCTMSKSLYFKKFVVPRSTRTLDQAINFCRRGLAGGGD
jgi:hypothetical protein